MESALYERGRLLVAVLSKNFSKVLLKNYIFIHLLLLEGHEQGALEKKLTLAPLMEQFKTATFRKSYW